MRRLGWIVLGLVVAIYLAWAAAALHFTGPRPPILANALAAGLLVASKETTFVRKVGFLERLATISFTDATRRTKISAFRPVSNELRKFSTRASIFG